MDMDSEDDLWLSQASGENISNSTLSEDELSQALETFEANQNAYSNNDANTSTVNEHTNPTANTSRFFSSNLENIDSLLEERIPGKTKGNTRWGYNIWVEWAKHKNNNLDIHTPFMSVPLDFTDITAEELNHWLPFFFVDIRKQNGERYPPRTMHQIACALLRHVRENCSRFDLNFMNEHDVRFRKSWVVLDSVMKKLHSDGLGGEIKRAQAISEEDEELLWSKNVVNFDSADGLSFGVFYYNCKCFGLRGRDEHRALDASQFTLGEDKSGKYVRFLGRESKNHKNGIKQRHIENKNIQQRANQVNPERCVVKLFEVYLQHIPPSGPFYKRPLDPSKTAQIRFSSQNIGVHSLADYMNKMFTQAGLSNKYTNHSGKVTAATTLFNKGMGKELVKSRTGHRSDAVLQYRRPSDATLQEISDALQPPTKKNKTVEQCDESVRQDKTTIIVKQGDSEVSVFLK